MTVILNVSKKPTALARNIVRKVLRTEYKKAAQYFKDNGLEVPPVLVDHRPVKFVDQRLIMNRKMIEEKGLNYEEGEFKGTMAYQIKHPPSDHGKQRTGLMPLPPNPNHILRSRK
jgi:hypothetical protein